MWPSLRRSADRFSLQEFSFLYGCRYQIIKLQEIKVVDTLNKELVMDILRSIVEIVTYGERRDPSIFECFMEHQILAEFLRLLNISRNSGIKAQLLHYLSIMIQNLDGEQSIYFCFSNEYINKIILHKYEFDGGDLALYYVSFLRTVSGKLNRDTICLLVKVQEDAIVSFPLYTEALKFSRHEEKMIQIAVRALTLSIYNVSDEMVYAFITRPPASDYFSDLVLNLRELCFHLDVLVNTTKDNYTHTMRMDLLAEADKFIDDLYYCKDILRVGKPHLSRLMTHNLLSLLILPLLLPLLQPYQTTGSPMSAVTSLYIVSRLLQVIDGKELVNSVAAAVLFPYTDSSMRDGGTISKTDSAESFLELLNEFKAHLMATSAPDSEVTEKGDMKCPSRHLWEHNLFSSHSGNLWMDDIQSKRSSFLITSTSSKFYWDPVLFFQSILSLYGSCLTLILRKGILQLIFSENHTLVLASLMFLLVLSESKDLDDSLSSFMGFAKKKIRKDKAIEQATHLTPSQPMDGNIFVRHVPQILNELLKFLASEPPLPVLRMWSIGWALQKLLACQEKRLIDHDLDLFNISYHKSCKNLLKEINRCWFDYIPITLKKEWESCKKALDESSQSKDPFFALEPPLFRDITDGDISSPLAWQRMVHAVKVFVLHHLLKTSILEGDFLENPFLHMRSRSMSSTSGRTLGVDVLSVNFGTELSSGPDIPCKIAFSKGNERDIFLIPTSKGIEGKLLLVEKLPLHSHQRVVVAVAPLAGLNPIIDENHPTWLHLRIRDYDPEVEASKTGRHQSNTSDDHTVDRRWTLGFLSSEACEAAHSIILKEISKQRSSVESLLAPFLQCSPEDLSSNDKAGPVERMYCI
ncbi:protein TRANSPARENT TESTA 9-like isoform X2 [Magnolia sinica]|uniref:protein TRANSPARENT TESTA 9-like isoform X2 n=1 Tax=Magnolia sinica TaxID=86752 RepID=UPI0026584C6D|nr:protein TRANSPARENT TESTA 9-like isoform X2 [Magnolia sinica]